MLLIEILTISSLLFLPFHISAQVLYGEPCPLLNLNYPPLDLYASHNVIQSAMAALNVNVTQALNQSTVYGQIDSQSNTISMDVYSLYDAEPLFTYHHTPERLIAQGSVGVQTVDSNTVYRIASISKLLTVYIYLIAVGDQTWNDPVTKYVPELTVYVEKNQAFFQNDRIDAVDWNSITIGSLASHLSGIAREEAYSPAFEQVLQSFGLPSTTRNQSAFCGIDGVIQIPCDRQAFFDDFLNQHPVTSPFTTAAYSNIAFQILGYAMESMTGKSMSDLFDEALVRNLDLNSTSYTVPSSPNTSFVPINATISLWEFDARGETPVGGYFSSLNDLRKVGKSILNSTILTPAQTRRWMKPHSFTANANFAVGAPWEILRAPGESVSWIYSKTGSFGAYSGIIALMPEYNVGITVLSAGLSATNTVRILSDMAVDIVVPAIYTASKATAVSSYTGTYTNSTSNSTITISEPDLGPGLVVSDWTLNGTQALPFLASLLGVNQTSQTLSMNIYPSGLTSNNGRTTSWRAIFRALPQPLDPGVFSENCVSWGMVNALTYGGVGLDEFVFDLDESGNAASVEPRASGLRMTRPNGSMVEELLQRLR